MQRTAPELLNEDEGFWNNRSTLSTVERMKPRIDPEAEPERRKLHVEMGKVLDAMTAGRDEPIRYYLDLTNGEVIEVFRSEFDLIDEDEEQVGSIIDVEPERFVRIEPLATSRQYDLMSEWAGSISDLDIRDKFDIALRGKGAFGRFREVVSRYPDLEADWRAARQSALVAMAEEWLRDDLGIEPVYVLTREERPDTRAAAAPATGPQIGLIDVLLLGAPDDKTELIGGRVRRWLPSATRSAARYAFKALARDVCAYSGVEWRKRFVDGKEIFDLGRIHLAVHDDGVEVSVDVSRSAWDAFRR